MMKYILVLAILIGGLFSTAQAQTTLFQSLVDSTPRCGTLTLPSDVVYPGGAVIRQCITIKSVGTRTVESKRGNFQVGAKILTTTPDPAITILPGVDGVSIEGVEIAPTGFVYDLVRIGEKSSAQDTTEEEPRNISLKNVWIHGLPDQDSQRGVSANGKYISITNSKISDIHGAGYDTQAILVYNGSGPFLIADNELQAAGENIMFGGADPAIPNLVPSDIQILRNYIWKPLSWKVGDPTYAGKHWTVKNLLELKNARNVVIAGNTFENNWTDGQAGVAILFTVRNQECTAPWSTVQGITFTDNTVKNTEGIFNFLGTDNEAEPGYFENGKPKCGDPGETYGSVRGSGFTGRNNVFYGIRGSLITLNGFDDVVLDHNTDSGRTWNLTTVYGKPSWGFRYTNSLTFDHAYGIYIEVGKVGDPNGLLPDGVIEQNVVVAVYDRSSWPLNNRLVDSLELSSDFRSPIVGAGADIDALNAAQGGASTPLPSPTPEPTANPDPSPLPTPSISPSPTPTPVIGIPAGSSVEVTSRVNVREGASITATVKFIAEPGLLGVTVGSCQQDPASVNVYCFVNFVDGTNGFVAMQYLSVVTQPTPSPSPSPTPTPMASPSPSPTPTPTPVPDPTPAPSPSPSPSPTPKCRKFNPKGKCVQWF
jgi:hypothetical protein